jgi:N-methylhydantoinase B
VTSVNGVTLEILRNYFRAIVEDMARVVERTAFTTFVKETADFSTGLVATTGEYNRLEHLAAAPRLQVGPAH